MRHGSSDAHGSSSARGSSTALTVGLVALALGLSGATGYVVGAATMSPVAEAATSPVSDAVPVESSAPAPSASSASPSATSPSAAAPSLPMDSGAMANSAMGTGTETLAEGQSGRSDANLASSEVEILNWVETEDPVFFITIDDGLNQSPEVQAFIEANQIPVTAFLTEYAVREHTDYFEAVTAYGGSIQNHTMVHGALNDPETDVEWEICETQDRFESQFGARPWMLRPPYGAGPNDPQVLKYAEQCGINRIVLWNVVVSDDNKVEYWDAPLRAGDIVLLHWVDGLEDGLAKILELGAEQGLTPAPLENYI